jgi:hypothetical protein
VAATKKTCLSQWLKILQGVEAEMLNLEHNPEGYLSGYDLFAIAEALPFIQHAAVVLLRSQHKLPVVLQEKQRMDSSQRR